MESARERHDDGERREHRGNSALMGTVSVVLPREPAPSIIWW